MPAEALTAARLQQLKPPVAGVLEMWDDRARGLCLRVFPTGRATWTFRYRPKSGDGRRRLGLGEYPSIGLAEARRRADRHRGTVSDGADPQAERRAQREAAILSVLIERYLSEEIEPKKKPATLALYRHYLRRLVAPRLGSKRAHAITRGEVAKLHRELGAKMQVSANRTIIVLSGLYTFATKHGMVPEGCNPARGIEKFREQGRERYLSTDELARLGRALRLGETKGLLWPGERATTKARSQTGQPSDRIVAACRRRLSAPVVYGVPVGEVLNLRWSEVDFERGLLLLPDSKTGRKAVVLNAPALLLLSELPSVGDYVVLGDDPEKPRGDLNKPWNLIRHHAGLQDVRLHDLRHTHASVGAGAGLGLPIIGKLLGHRHSETTSRYAHLDADPLRVASNRIGGAIADAMGDARPSSAPLAQIRGRGHG